MSDEADLRAHTLRVLQVAFDTREWDARLRAEHLHDAQAKRVKTLRLASSGAWLRNDDANADRLDRLADVEDAFLQDLRRLLHKERNRKLQRYDGPTAYAMLAGGRDDAIERLLSDKRIKVEEAQAAFELAAIYRWVGSGLAPRAVNLERIRYGHMGEDWLPLAHAFIYRPWLAAVNVRTREIVMAVAVHGVSIEAVRKIYRMRWDTALSHLRDGLQEYVRIREGYWSVERAEIEAVSAGE